jgi:predicted amidohydrolase
VDLKLAVVQMDCRAGDVAANLAEAERLIGAAAAQGANFAVLPEMCTTGYFVGERLSTLAEPIPGPTTERLQALAAQHHLYLVAGMPERGEGGTYNSSVLVSPHTGLVGKYRKVHLFSTEKQHFRSGDAPALYHTEFGRVALTICYDLIFPEYIRCLVLRGAQVIVNSTNWITNEWQTSRGWNGRVIRALASTRALENTVHVAMADRVGIEAGWQCLGHSCIAAPSGALLGQLEDGVGVAGATIALQDKGWDEWRTIAAYLQDRRTELYERLQAEPNTRE